VNIRTSCEAALTAALAVLLSACAGYGPQAIPKGSSLESVMQRMGTPTAEHRLPSGLRRLEYATGPFGRQTHVFDFDASGHLVGSDQVLTESHFNAIQAGMTAEEVLARIGKPSTVWAIPRQHQLVWSYRYDTFDCRWFMVGMGTADDKVVDTAYGPDPICDDDGFFGRMRMGR
jgi:hypothetical protein